jgi:hypothetical protein
MEKLLKLKEALNHVLKTNILKYWVDNTVDEENGGFIGHIYPECPHSMVFFNRLQEIK